MLEINWLYGCNLIKSSTIHARMQKKKETNYNNDKKEKIVFHKCDTRRDMIEMLQW